MPSVWWAAEQQRAQEAAQDGGARRAGGGGAHEGFASVAQRSASNEEGRDIPWRGALIEDNGQVRRSSHPNSRAWPLSVCAGVRQRVGAAGRDQPLTQTLKGQTCVCGAGAAASVEGGAGGGVS